MLSRIFAFSQLAIFSHVRNSVANDVHKLLDSVLVPGQSVTLCMVKQDRGVHITNVEQSHRTIYVWIERADYVVDNWSDSRFRVRWQGGWLTDV